MIEGWRTKKLADICSIELGRTPARDVPGYWDSARSSGYVWLSIADLLNTENGIVNDSKEYISEAGSALCKKVEKGTLLMSFKLTLGRMAIAGRDLYTNEAIVALKLHSDASISQKFLFYALSFFDWNKATEGDQKIKGRTLNKAKLKEIPIAFPSHSEQCRIVAILDEAFERIATAKANAESNLQSARDVFESFMDEALFRHEHSCIETTLGAEIDLLAGYAFSSKGYTDKWNGIRLLRGDNIMQGYLRWDDPKYWPIDDVMTYERFALREGDVVLAMDRPWVKAGLKRAQVGANDLPCLQLQRTARLRPRKRMRVDFLFHLVGSRLFSRHLLGVQKGLGVPHISGKQIESFRFMLPSMEQQASIAAKLDELRHNVVRLEMLYERKISSLEELKKSILGQAFAGRL